MGIERVVASPSVNFLQFYQLFLQYTSASLSMVLLSVVSVPRAKDIK